LKVILNCDNRVSLHKPFLSLAPWSNIFQRQLLHQKFSFRNNVNVLSGLNARNNHLNVSRFVYFCHRRTHRRSDCAFLADQQKRKRGTNF